MKSLYVFFILYLPLSIFAQSWVDLGIKGGWGANLIINNNLFNDNAYNHKLSSGYSFGGKIGFNFNQEHEITFDAMFTTFRQGFTYSIEDTINDVTTNYSSEFGFNAVNLILMYRRNKNGSYLEFGPCISFLQSPYFKDGANDYIMGANNFNLNNQGLVLGFGSYIVGTENFGITSGIRITHYLSDLLSEEGKNNLLFSSKQYDSYTPSKALFIELVLEANFDFAYMAKASCGRKKILFF